MYACFSVYVLSRVNWLKVCNGDSIKFVVKFNIFSKSSTHFLSYADGFRNSKSKGNFAFYHMNTNLLCKSPQI